MKYIKKYLTIKNFDNTYCHKYVDKYSLDTIQKNHEVLLYGIHYVSSMTLNGTQLHRFPLMEYYLTCQPQLALYKK